MFLLISAEQQDRLAAHAGVDVHDHRSRSTSSGELIDAQHERQRIQPEAAVLPRDENSEQPRFSGRTDSLLWKPVVAIDLGCKWQGHRLRQLAHAVAKARVLRRWIQVHQ